MTGETFVLGLVALLSIIVSVVLWNVFATARTKIDATRNKTPRNLAAGSDADYRQAGFDLGDDPQVGAPGRNR